MATVLSLVVDFPCWQMLRYIRPIWSSIYDPYRSLMIFPESHPSPIRSFESPARVCAALAHRGFLCHAVVWGRHCRPSQAQILVAPGSHSILPLWALCQDTRKREMGMGQGLVFPKHLPKKQIFFSLRLSKVIWLLLLPTTGLILLWKLLSTFFIIQIISYLYNM